jgi:sialate O-acetylesterase
MKSRLLLACVYAVGCMSVCTTAAAAVRLPPILGDNMVLQRRSTVNIWGWADPGESIRVKAGWMNAAVSAVAGIDGKWQVRLGTAKAGGPYVMTIQGENRIVLKNVMLGDVWVCSGQSNMEFTIKMLGGWAGSYSADKKDLLKNGYSSLRLFTVAKDTSSAPLDTCRGSWRVAGPDEVESFSATAYFFGRELTRRLKVPVGLISSNWGGTPAEAWTRLEDVTRNNDLAFYLNDPNKNDWFPAKPGVLFNAMIHPLTHYPIKGVIWYQGESNRNDAQLYHTLMGTLIAGWRSEWNLGSFPFYYVQIAPFGYEEPFSGALLREAQLKTLTVPNSGMAVTMDIGDANDIHPKNKQEVGRRLALWAFAHTYGIKVPAFSGPLYRSMQREGNAIRVFFDHAEGGLVAHSQKIDGFALAGPDRSFVDAGASIEGATVLVSSPKVADPVAVRFAFTNTSESKLFNHAGLPASSFRTDDWPVLTATVSITAMYDSSRNGVLFGAVSKAPDVEIRYTLDGSEPMASSPLVEGRVSLTHSGSINARAFRGGVASPFVAHRDFVSHLVIGKPVAYTSPFDSSYAGGGKFGLVDGVSGSVDFRDGSWQGFKKVDLEVTIDLGDTLELHEIRSGFLQNQGSWIFFPGTVEYSVSMDGNSFVSAAMVPNETPDSTIGSIRKSFPATLSKTPARFLRLKATNIGQCPSWHPGRGQDAWLFVDEIIVN